MKKQRISAEQNNGTEVSLKGALIRLTLDVLTTAVFTCLIFTFVIGVTVQNGNDMYPALRDGDVILYYRHPGFVPTEAVVYEVDGTTKTGRIAAVSGTVISRTGDDQLTINGIFQPEDPDIGIFSKTLITDGTDLPYTVSKDCLFILNDNRKRLSDSRTYGEIERESVRGRIITVLRRRQI